MHRVNFFISPDLADGLKAISAVTHVSPAVALLDIQMPRLDGLEVARQLRQSMDTGGVSSCALIAITGNVLGSRDRNVVVHNGMSVNVTGNTIYGGQTLNVAFKNCHQSLVGSNTIASRPASWASTSADGLLMEDCNACTLIGNIHNGCRFGDALLGGSITVRNSRNISISGCQINNSAVRGIDISNSVQCRISDNSLHNDGTNESLRQAIRIAGTSFRNIVQNNSIVWNGIYPKGVSPDGRRPAQEGVIECSEKCGRVLANSIW